ncbi:MBL fold metallo-hydrolase [Fuscibacter oryzae]|uniref:MBL fold metallo-hydrolase n=1 Tax=Fuscibacter oryzae TaxID=2803939 RepID=A0A8J7MTP8_9RHOB|nr:MBL fold metallo-hydrolase [Fuscibacter oryzae]MBL4929983.1 MBL fold metallo-hydrolase [Fuscibacter oryzae]
MCRWITLLALFASPALGQEPSACIALAQNGAQVVRVAFGDPLPQSTVRLRFLNHASFALETPGGITVITDYTGQIGNPDVVPDVVTMNNAHDSHFTNSPDPRIPHVLRGWGPPGLPARIDETVGDLRIRNVTTDTRGPFGEGARANGNSIFLFEVAGLCIAHLGHLHQMLSADQRARIGRVDVVMVPVDGGYTMDQRAMAEVVKDLHARLIIPMHWFGPKTLAAFLAQSAGRLDIVTAGGPEVEISRATLPRRPTILLLDPALIP